MVQEKLLTLLRPAADKCQECAIKHLPGEPHNKESLFYQVKFFQKNCRYPTWKDAISHCEKKVREAWEKELRKAGVWEVKKI